MPDGEVAVLGDMAWYIPVLIFMARIVDVSMGTVRTILTVGGSKYTAAAIGFFEVAIWALAVGGLIRYLANPIALVSYAGGFAAGTMIGVMIEEQLKLGYRTIRAIDTDRSRSITAALREAGFGATRVDGWNGEGPVELCYTVVRRKRLDEALEVVRRVAPDAFIAVGRADRATGGPFTGEQRLARRPWHRFSRLGK